MGLKGKGKADTGQGPQDFGEGKQTGPVKHTKRASEKGPRTNQGGIPRAAPEKAQKGGRPRGQSPTTRAPPPKGQEEEGEKYIIQRRQIHPDSQTSNSDRRKRSTKRQNYKGDQAKARAAWSDPVKRGIKESLRLGG